MRGVGISPKEDITALPLGSRYRALRLVGSVYGIAGWLLLLLPLLIGSVMAWPLLGSDQSLERFLGGAILLGSILIGVIVGVSMAAVSDIVAWMIDLASDLRRSCFLLDRLDSGRGDE